MKIRHYLTLLTDRIVSTNSGNGEDDKHQLSNPAMQLLVLQKMVHQKCLLRVRSNQDKAIPQIRLPKYQHQPPMPPPLLVNENEDKTNYPIILTADEHQIKIDLWAEDNPELLSCPFCEFTDTSGDKLNSHIDNQHSEQFESYTTVHSTSNVESSEEHTPYLAKYTCDFCPLSFVKFYNKKSHMDAIHSSSVKGKRRINKCHICGAMVGSANLAKHKQVHHAQYLLTLGKDANKYQTKCEYCPLTFTNVYNKERHLKAVHLEKSMRQSSAKVNLRACEICGAMVSTKNMSTHRKTRHKDVLNIEEGPRGRNKPKIFRCDKCGIGYAVQRSLWRHLKSKCGGNGKRTSDKIVNELMEDSKVNC